jgi:hypothetical protein
MVTSVAKALWSLLLTCVFALSFVGVDATVTAASNVVHNYDAPAIAHVDALSFGRAEASPTQLSEVRERFAPRSAEERGTSTTPAHAFIATYTADPLGTIVSGATVDPAWGTTVIRYLP